MNKMHANHAYQMIREALTWASLQFKAMGIEPPRLTAEVLLQQLLGWTKAKLLAEDGQPFPPEKQAVFADWVARRLAGEPLQYIVGVQEFYGREFHVNSAVLIPRPETEFLIESVLQRRNGWQTRPVVADIGTGSGAIAVTLALEWPAAEVCAVDLSPDAIRVAQANASRLGAEVRFLQGNLLEPLLQEGRRLDVLVSNPPYIPSGDIAGLMREVREYEPHLALDGGTDGLEPYRRITSALPQVMKSDGPALVCFEVGIHQATAVADLIIKNWPGAKTELVKDLQGIERVVVGRLRPTSRIGTGERLNASNTQSAGVVGRHI